MRRLAVFALPALLAACNPGYGEPPPLRDLGRRPDWSATASSGKTLSAADFDGKVVIVDFWATWCPPCRREIPGFIDLQTRYGEKGLAIVGFSFDNDAAAHAAYQAEQKMNYPSIWVDGDAAKGAVEAFQGVIGPVEGLPTTIVVDRKGRIVWRHVGYAPKEIFEAVVRQLL
jgi:thiol-disulfide isomerase/thioredoxin